MTGLFGGYLSRLLNVVEIAILGEIRCLFPRSASPQRICSTTRKVLQIQMVRATMELLDREKRF